MSDGSSVDPSPVRPPATGETGVCAYPPCGAVIIGYHHTRRYCCDDHRRQHYHERTGHRPRRRRQVGYCVWCGGPLTASNGHRPRYHDRCRYLAQSHRSAMAFAERMATMAETYTAQHHEAARVLREERLPNGVVIAVVWDGSAG